ncbi:MAG: hypothetical protein Q4D13_01940 [Erysipelotrichaceae bacterium]|nr:hypothetical protein [Erysipelotrichaceae bacterium]
MAELLVLLIFVMAATVLSLSNYHELNMEHYYFMNEYLLNQSISINEYTDIPMDHNVYFNSMGRVRNGDTIHFDTHSVIVHLGNGYITYE